MRQFNRPAASLLIGAFAGAVVALTPLSTSAGSYYKWVDENNVTHYGERPPAGKESEKVKISTGHSEPTKYDNPATDAAKKAGAKKPGEEEGAQPELSAQQKQEYCQRAKANYETLAERAVVRMQDAYGNVKELSDEERETEKQRAKQAVDTYCSG